MPAKGSQTKASTPIAEGEGRIRPRARLLNTIGAELISSEVVAVIELVRNCYDADATHVELVFDRPEDELEGTLEIRDDGHGMTREVLLGPWLEPATDYKAGPSSGLGGDRSPRGRRRLGSKGVGRFAAQRLGSHLQVWTRATGSETALEAEFDWDMIEDGQYLDQIRIPWREIHVPPVSEAGTDLRISGLRSQWTPDRFEKLALGLSRLINPAVREEFRVTMTINGSLEEIRPALESTKAMYSLSGAVDEYGLCRIDYADLTGDEEYWERTVVWPEEGTCGPFTFEINAWDLDSKALRHFFEITGYNHGLQNFRRALRDHSGISLYRDGFRVLPYGEPDNDWLRLDRRRVNNPTMRLSNNQVLGHIQLTADGNVDLRDQTNREGLVSNEAYAHLQEVVLELLQFLEVRRFTGRRSMDFLSTNKSSLPLDPSLDIHDDQLEMLIDSVSRSGEARALEIRSRFRELREAAQESVKHYAGLASAGYVAALVFRQLEHPLRQLKSELGVIREEIQAITMDSEDREDLLDRFARASAYAETMAARVGRLDPMAISGRGRRVSRISLNDTLAPVAAAFEDEGARLGVSVDFRCDDDILLTTNREVAQHALANLLDNAVWWASQGDASPAVVVVRADDTGFVVSDNGPGISEEHRDLVFDPMFTTRSDAHGLGLTLVRDLLATVGGSVKLAALDPVLFEVTLA